MNILFLGDIVGTSGCNSIKKNLSKIVKQHNIDFLIANGENSHSSGHGISTNISNELFACGIDVLTSGNHIWDQKEILDYIKEEKRLLRPFNMKNNLPGRGFGIFFSKNNMKVGVLNLMGNVFMKKSEDIFEIAQEFIERNKLKNNFDFLIVDIHGEITSQKMALGHFFDGKATLIVGTYTHVPTNDARILSNGTAYQTDAGMCGDYDSVIGMNKINSINRFLKKNSNKHFPANGEATLCGAIIKADNNTGLAVGIKSFVFGGKLENEY